MIGKLTGVCSGTTPDGAALIDVEGVGYAVHVTAPTLARLIDGKGTASLFIHTAVREDAIDLYGFETSEELVFFKQCSSTSRLSVYLT
jgi:Holliday junction DNA helicase RuvA